MKRKIVILCAIAFALCIITPPAKAQEETQICGQAQTDYDKCQDNCDRVEELCVKSSRECGDDWLACEGVCGEEIPWWCGFWVY